MVEKNTINLLGKIEEQKKNDLIIFTTYTFDVAPSKRTSMQKVRFYDNVQNP